METNDSVEIKDDDKFFGVKRLSEILKMHPMTIYRIIKKKPSNLPLVKIGGRYKTTVNLLSDYFDKKLKECF